MPFRFVCPACGTTLQADESLLGKRVRCGNCENVFVAAANSPIATGYDLPLLAPAPEVEDQGGIAIASLVLGILSLNSSSPAA
jgi:predicted Zn finger-like uncharacterized protein